MKLAVSGCPRNCAESYIKDVEVVAVEGGRREIYIGGAAGAHIRMGDLLATVDTPEEVITLTAGIAADLDARIRAAVDAYADPWQEGRNPAVPGQFRTALPLTPLPQVPVRDGSTALGGRAGRSVAGDPCAQVGVAGQAGAGA